MTEFDPGVVPAPSEPGRRTSDRAASSILEVSNDVLQWRDERRACAGLECARIPWSQARSWRLDQGQLVHETHRFFSIRGLRTASSIPELNGIEQPIIVQPEVGILGFLVRRSERGPELLMQAKTEPGNVGAVQLAPTVQATVSNYTRVHGGAPTPYLSYFLASEPDRVGADVLQSEQGTRFLNKYNRNVTVLVGGDGLDPVSDVWRWCDASAVLALLQTDFCVNTDARSALVCSDWSALCQGGRPFQRWQGRGGFGEALLESFRATDDGAESDMNGLRRALAEMQSRVALHVFMKPLDELAGWTMDDHRITDAEAMNFEIPIYRIAARDREVARWDQPLVRNYGEGVAVLLMQRRRGVLHFLLRGSVEIGFANKVQFGTTIQRSPFGRVPAEAGLGLPNCDLVEHASCRQSDEGGRFDQSIVEYKVVEVPEDEPVQEDDFTCWATLGQVYRLLRTPGLITNEARSTLALLLLYL